MISLGRADLLARLSLYNGTSEKKGLMQVTDAGEWLYDGYELAIL
jgi:hypothetical protein